MIADLLSPPEIEIRQDKKADRDAFIVIMAGTVLLFVFHYWGRPDFYVRSGLVEWVSSKLG